MFRPMIHAPRFSIARAAKSSSGPVEPLPSPYSCVNVRVVKIHSCRPSLPSPSGSSVLWFVPAPNASREREKPLTRTLDIASSDARDELLRLRQERRADGDLHDVGDDERRHS